MIKAAVAVAVLALAGGVVAQNTFCERYTAAVFPGQGGGPGPAYSNATNQFALVKAVVTCAFLGTTTGGANGFPCGAVNSVTGLYYENLNGQYFNGTTPSGSINYLPPTSNLLTLAAHLTQFFAAALGCRAAVPVYPYAGNPSMVAAHPGLTINQATFGAFLGQVAASMTSFGVVAGSGATGDLTYVVARMGPFWRYPTGMSSNNQICNAADCQLATGFSEFDITSGGAFTILVGNTMTGTTVTVAIGDAVHWNLNGGTDGIVQTATAAGTTPLSGGISSGTGISSYTWTTATAGTYYFYNAGSTSNGCTVIVGNAMSTGMTGMTGTMTGMTGMTGTGTAGDASSIAPTMMLAAVGAAVVAAML